MKLRVTSITAPQVGELVNSVTTKLEDRLRPVLSPNDYGGGIEQFSVFFISVNSEPIENERYCCVNNRAGRYKDMFTGKMVAFVSIAIPVDPLVVLGSPKHMLNKIFDGLLLHELESPAYAMPKKFDRQRLLADVNAVLAAT